MTRPPDPALFLPPASVRISAVRDQPFQFGLWTLQLLLLAVACVLGVTQSQFARAIVVGACLLVLLTGLLVLLTACWLACLAVVFIAADAAEARRCVASVGRAPFRVYQLLFERRLARLRMGAPARRVRRVLGRPARIDGFGDRLYWSYRIAGHRYAVSLDPRRLAAKYSNGLARDVRPNR